MATKCQAPAAESHYVASMQPQNEMDRPLKVEEHYIERVKSDDDPNGYGEDFGQMPLKIANAILGC